MFSTSAYGKLGKARDVEIRTRNSGAIIVNINAMLEEEQRKAEVTGIRARKLVYLPTIGKTYRTWYQSHLMLLTRFRTQTGWHGHKEHSITLT